MDTGLRAGAGARALLGAQAARALIQLASVVVLSRLLLPADLGTFAIVAAVVQVATVVGDLGLSVAAIREPSLTRRQWTGLFWLNAAMGLVLTGALAGLAPAVAGLVGQPGVAVLLAAVSPVFLLNGVSIQYRVELARRGRYLAMAGIETAAPAVGLLVAVVWAALSPTVRSLVAQQVAAALTLALLAVLAVRVSPGLPRRRAGIGRLVRLGGAASVASLVFALSTSLAPVALGRAASASIVGAFSRASQLSSLVHNNLAIPLTRVVVPWLAQAHGTEAFALRFRRVLVAYGVTVGLLTALVGGLAESATTVALGARWVEDTAPLLAILSLALLVYAFGYVTYWALLAAARTRRFLLCDAPGHLVTIAGILALGHRGAAAICWAIVAGSVVRVLCYVVLGMPAVGVSRRSPLGAALPIATLCAGVYVGGRMIEGAVGTTALAVAAGLAWTGVLLALHWWLVPPFRADLREAGRMVRQVAGARLRAAPRAAR